MKLKLDWDIAGIQARGGGMSLREGRMNCVKSVIKDSFLLSISSICKEIEGIAFICG